MFTHAASPVVGANDAGTNETRPDLAARAATRFDPTDLTYLVAWQDGTDIRGHRYSQTGPVGSPITIRATPNHEGSPAVAAGQSEFSVGYLEQPVGTLLNIDVNAARVLLDGSVPQSHSLIDDPGAVLQSGLRAASQPLPAPGQPLRNTTMFVWTGQNGAASGPNDIRARRYEPLVAQTSRFGVACAGPGGTLPRIDTWAGSPTPGNTNWAVTLTGAPPNSLAVLLLGNDPIDVPIGGTTGCSLYTNLPFLAVLPALTNAVGYAQIALPIPVDIPPLAWQMQWGVETPGWNAFGWISSDDLDVWFTQ